MDVHKWGLPLNGCFFFRNNPIKLAGLGIITVPYIYICIYVYIYMTKKPSPIFPQMFGQRSTPQASVSSLPGSGCPGAGDIAEILDTIDTWQPGPRSPQCDASGNASPMGSMYGIYANIYHQYTPVLLASIYHTWIRHVGVPGFFSLDFGPCLGSPRPRFADFPIDWLCIYAVLNEYIYI